MLRSCSGLDNSKGKSKFDMRHHGQANDLGAGFEVAKWRRFCHPQTLRNHPALLKSVSSDTAVRADLEPDDSIRLFSGHHQIQHDQIELSARRLCIHIGCSAGFAMVIHKMDIELICLGDTSNDCHAAFPGRFVTKCNNLGFSFRAIQTR